MLQQQLKEANRDKKKNSLTRATSLWNAVASISSFVTFVLELECFFVDSAKYLPGNSPQGTPSFTS